MTNEWEQEKIEKNRQRALKAWETIRARQEDKEKLKVKEKEFYKSKEKEQQRDIMVKLMKERIEGFNERNPLRDQHKMMLGIYLESPELLFTKKIVDEGLNHEIFFHIPNDQEFDKFHHGRGCGGWGRSGPNFFGEIGIQFEEHQHGDYYNEIQNVILVDKSYKDFIQKRDSVMDHVKGDEWSYIFIWADYCGAFSSFSEDIDLTFSRKLLGNGSIFALTFNGRDVAKKKKLPKYATTNCIVAVNDFVVTSAKRYGYEVVMLPESGFYKKGMYTAIFSVSHKQMSEDQIYINRYIDDIYKVQKMLEYKLSRLKEGYKDYEEPITVTIGGQNVN